MRRSCDVCGVALKRRQKKYCCNKCKNIEAHGISYVEKVDHNELFECSRAFAEGKTIVIGELKLNKAEIR